MHSARWQSHGSDLGQGPVVVCVEETKAGSHTGPAFRTRSIRFPIEINARIPRVKGFLDIRIGHFFRMRVLEHFQLKHLRSIESADAGKTQQRVHKEHRGH